MSKSLFSSPCQKACFHTRVKPVLRPFLNASFHINVEKHVSMSVLKSLFSCQHWKACFTFVSEWLFPCARRKARAMSSSESLFSCLFWKASFHVCFRKHVSPNSYIAKKSRHPNPISFRSLGIPNSDLFKNLGTSILSFHVSCRTIFDLILQPNTYETYCAICSSLNRSFFSFTFSCFIRLTQSLH